MSPIEPLRANRPLLEAVDLHKHFSTKRLLGFGKETTVRAVDGVNLSVFSGETFGLVGESGCGKSTLARVLVQLMQPTRGDIRFQGRTLGGRAADNRQLRQQVQIIFQDPYSSLNPSFSIRTILRETYRLKGTQDRNTEQQEMGDLLERVGLRREVMDRYPHELSGGQRQRVVIARALAPGPSLVVADEPVSALDVSIQSQVLNLMIDLQQQLGLTYVFISHDLNVIQYICDRIAVMYLGCIVETGPTEAVLSRPRHPYTEGLLAGLPSIHDRHREHRRILGGDLPSPVNIPTGCRFNPRCSYATERCRVESPTLIADADGRGVACHNPVGG
jgi:oligopeptide/dipeptide ABC transporter ATP-binding protein